MPNMKKWREKNMTNTNNMEYNAEQTQGNNPGQREVGMNCPKCGKFIKTSIFQLLTSNALICQACGLKLNIDRMKSRSAFDALRKVQAAQDNLERKSHFSR